MIFKMIFLIQLPWPAVYIHLYIYMPCLNPISLPNHYIYQFGDNATTILWFPTADKLSVFIRLPVVQV